MSAISQKLTNLFPLWTLIGGVLAIIYPPLFTWFQGDWITWGLGIIMLGMGLTLKPEDFKGIVTQPKWVVSAILLQYLLMPLLGWGVAKAFQLPTPFAVGLILVGCCPGGTASNVITFLARANVALSVTLTTISTFIAIIATPLLTSLLVGDRVNVNAMGLFLGTLQVVLFPISLGLLINNYLPKMTGRIVPHSPLIAVIAIVMIVSSIIGAGKTTILESGLYLGTAVLCMHTLGFVLGYVLSKFINKDEIVSRTISIEVGMQNSGLGAFLAKANFANPATAIPAALSALTHCLLGSLLASYWRNKTK